MSLIRQSPADVQIDAVTTYETLIRKMDQYFGRVDDHDQLDDAIVNRYGIGIMEVRDKSGNSDAVRETYVKQNIAAAVVSGLIEGITLGFGQRVSSALASLFTESGMRLDLSHESVEDLTDAESLIDEQRELGQFSTATVESDLQSCSVGSSIVLTQYTSGHLDYTRLSPADLYVIFGDTVTEDGVERATNISDIEDASAIIINMGAVDAGKNRYLGIVGRSPGYPVGRWVTFYDYDGRQLPTDDDPNAIDYRLDDGRAGNPLSWYAEENPDLVVPEYPIAIIKGGICDTAPLTPITNSLYLDALEIDVAASHTLSKSQECIVGTTVIERTLESPHALPRNTSGVMALEPGQSANKLPGDASGAQASMDVLERLMIHIAAGYDVPDYMVVSRDHTLDASSGVALEIKARPLKKNRARRINLNRGFVDRLFDIEKTLLGIHHDVPEDEAALSLLFDCVQNWEPGKLKLPENKNELITRLNLMLDKGTIDVIEYIRQAFVHPSDDDSVEMYERMSERKDEYPPLNKEEMDDIADQQRQFGGD